MTARVVSSALGARVRDRVEDWRTRGQCATSDPEVMFPPEKEAYSGPSWQAAKAICAACPVLAACEAFYRAAGPDATAFGVHAGRDPQQWEAVFTAPKEAPEGAETAAAAA